LSELGELEFMLNLKMYILIRESVPTGFAALASAHASLACYLKFQDDDLVKKWISDRFYKAICVVSDSDFEHAKKVEDHVVLTESRLDGQEVAIAFKPREEYPKAFRFYKLY